jgi:molybdopterin converting factor small subunit
MGLFGKRRPTIKVHVMIRGRIGEGWYDVDTALKAPEGVTLGELITLGEKKGIPFRDALDNSPHLRDTLMLNGDRCPVEEHRDRVLADGDELYLLAPLAGG